ncbi:VOC family protein [Collinsella provencensis]|uniref:VOC family protein n=1 Tax=Collinsella provencensis TaxID=1937461 RepID=UPI000C828430|nr:VOC family protein [Collinsella provencensis]
MQFKMAHTEIHVLDLDASLAFYAEALDLHPVREKGPEDGSWKLVFLGNEASECELELTWNKGRVEPYNQGGRDIHLAFAVEDMDAAHELHERMGCIVKENPAMGIYFIADPDGFYLEIIPAK